MFKRPTSLASAFINAAIKSGDLRKQVDHQHWVARRVALNCDKPKFGVVTEVDTRPQRGVKA